METYHFTFGSDHLKGRGLTRYITIEGADYSVAREVMVALYGREWCAQYSAAEFKGYLERWPDMIEHLKVTLSGPVYPEPAPGWTQPED